MQLTHTANPVANFPFATYADVMYYLHTIRITPEDKQKVVHRLSEEISGKNLSRIYSRLDYLSTLKDDWDGEGALPVSKRVIDNLKSVLLISLDADWQDWLVGADANAALGLQSDKTNACISLGAKEFSYYARINGKRLGESHINFNSEKYIPISLNFNKFRAESSLS